ncbi:hypothetical protein NM688_g5824 [Phlebia brevispora]|uniref:Uncharacterized protein n=1 Tax=Phlebia brevispora TaxID=194682 RepID=A0ACC1SP71_9APHY|nr:hypothetical protein NM688_g5824 [Phlebia brevispora]
MASHRTALMGGPEDDVGSHPTSHLGMEAARRKIAENIEACVRGLAELDDKKDCLRLEICGLKSQYNETFPVARLPSEVLGMVFVAYVSDFWQACDDRRRVLPVPDSPAPHWLFGWFSILHWARIQSVSRSRVQQLLEHSGQLPLTVLLLSLERKSTVPLEVYSGILEAFPRIRHLELPVDQKACGLLQSLEARHLDAPLLEVLCVRLPSSIQGALPALSTMVLPKLSRLSLTGGTLLALQTVIRPTVEHLKLTNLSRKRPRITDLIPVLEQLPSLKSLSLHDATKSREFMLVDEVRVPARTVNLPRLEALNVHEKEAGLMPVYLLNSLVFPPSARMSISADTEGPDNLLHVRMLSSLARKIRRLGSSGSPPVSILVGYLGTQTIMLWSTLVEALGTLSFLDTHPAHVDISLPMSYGSIDWIIRAFLVSLDLRSVVSMSVQRVLKADHWLCLFGRTEQLETLWIDGAANVNQCMRVFGTPLSDFWAGPAPNETPLGLPLPNLKDLKLDVRYRGNPEEDSLRETTISFSLVTQALEARKQNGIDLEHIEVKIDEPRDISDEDIDMLYSLVESVEIYVYSTKSYLCDGDSDVGSPDADANVENGDGEE